MAGRPVPKPADQRRRRNKVEETTLPSEGNTGPFPPLPEWRDWRPDTVEWYEEWCRSPMATEWLPVHFRRLHQVAVLYDAWLETPSLELTRELRLQLEDFGGTPNSLRRMGRKVVPRAEVVAHAAVKRPVRRLRAVDPVG